MNIIDQYFSIAKEYSNNDMVVLYKVGLHYYKIFSYDIEYIVELSRLLNLHATSAVNLKYEKGRKRPYMIGFPISAYNSYESILPKHNYVIIKVDGDEISIIPLGG